MGRGRASQPRIIISLTNHRNKTTTKGIFQIILHEHSFISGSLKESALIRFTSVKFEQHGLLHNCFIAWVEKLRKDMFYVFCVVRCHVWFTFGANMGLWLVLEASKNDSKIHGSSSNELWGTLEKVEGALEYSLV